MKRVLLLAMVVACGDNNKATPSDGSIDSPVDAAIDAPPDAPPDAMTATFTSFVIDLVQNKTSNTTNAVPFSTFMGLPDPDLNNPNAYNALFP